MPYASHSYWILLTIVVILKPNFSMTKQRYNDRLIGTLIGCIEHDPAILDGMKTLLQAWGSDVVAVPDPEAAMEAIAEIQASGRRLTGILVDYHLDRGNGIAAIRAIRGRFGKEIPAILITADRSPHVRSAARQDRIAVQNKPVKPASLRALLGQWRSQQMVAAE